MDTHSAYFQSMQKNGLNTVKKNLIIINCLIPLCTLLMLLCANLKKELMN